MNTPSPALKEQDAVAVEVQKDMADRRVRQTGKDEDGDITSLCNVGESWSPRTKADAVNDIRIRIHSYYVQEAGNRSEVIVTSDGHLKTLADTTSANNLDSLPDC